VTDPLLVANGLTMRFGGITAVRDISLSLDPGQMRCIIGPNGAGKSTLFSMIAGTLRPTTGTIHFLGQDMVGLPVHVFARRGIARKFQVPSFFASMTAAGNLEVADRGRQARDRAGRVQALLATLGLESCADTRAGALAHGQKQWLEIGMALMADPQLLLLDEPTAGMTADETQRTAGLLRGFEGRLTILVIEHDMRFVRALACRTTVMHQGQIIADGAFEQIESNEFVRDVYLGRQ
jgi:branched-chain amino acid transport system ATP-binding protein